METTKSPQYFVSQGEPELEAIKRKHWEIVGPGKAQNGTIPGGFEKVHFQEDLHTVVPSIG